MLNPNFPILNKDKHYLLIVASIVMIDKGDLITEAFDPVIDYVRDVYPNIHRNLYLGEFKHTPLLNTYLLNLN
jgi:hypothetical protein